MKDPKSGTHCRRPRLPSRAARAPASHRQHCQRAGTPNRTTIPALRRRPARQTTNAPIGGSAGVLPNLTITQGYTVHRLSPMLSVD